MSYLETPKINTGTYLPKVCVFKKRKELTVSIWFLKTAFRKRDPVS